MKHKTETKLFWVAAFISSLLWGGFAYVTAITENPYWVLGMQLSLIPCVGFTVILRNRNQDSDFWTRVDSQGVKHFGGIFAIGTYVMVFASLSETEWLGENIFERIGAIATGAGFLLSWLLIGSNALKRSWYPSQETGDN